jgi:hypothetical protein
VSTDRSADLHGGGFLSDCRPMFTGLAAIKCVLA